MNLTLTKKQLEILELSADGLTNKEIANKLSMSEHTIRNTFVMIYDRCGALNRAHAIAIAFRQGWIC